MMTLLAGLQTIEDASRELLMANGWFLQAKLVPELTIFNDGFAACNNAWRRTGLCQ